MLKVYDPTFPIQEANFCNELYNLVKMIVLIVFKNYSPNLYMTMDKLFAHGRNVFIILRDSALL